MTPQHSAMSMGEFEGGDDGPQTFLPPTQSSGMICMARLGSDHNEVLEEKDEIEFHTHTEEEGGNVCSDVEDLFDEVPPQPNPQRTITAGYGDDKKNYEI